MTPGGDDERRRVMVITPIDDPTDGTRRTKVSLEVIHAAAERALGGPRYESLFEVVGDSVPTLVRPEAEGESYLDEVDLIFLFADVPSPGAYYTVGAAQARGVPLVVLTSELAPGLRTVRVNTLRYDEAAVGSSDFAADLEQVVRYALDSESGPARRSRTPSVFVSYSHVDAEVLQRLMVHVRPLERSASIDLWSDQRLAPGSDWRQEIRSSIETCDYALLLVSADFLASDFVASDELPPILEQAERRGVTVASLIVGHCRFARIPELVRYQAVNSPDRPYYSMDGNARDQVLDQLVAQMEQAISSSA